MDADSRWQCGPSGTEARVNSAGLLDGVRVVEVSSFVAVPLAGMTLAMLGADVVRVDPIGGAADNERWPITDAGDSIYWAELNKAKQSVTANFRSADGRDFVARLAAQAGVFITNRAGPDEHSFTALSSRRSDLIHVEVCGRADGSTAVDYTVNAGVGFPLVTGSEGSTTPTNHVLPAWDVACGLYTALAVASAVRDRERTGRGRFIRIPLEDVALALTGHLGFLTEAMVNGTERKRIGTAVYGQYGHHFDSCDGATFMLVALTARHFRDLVSLTCTGAAVDALAEALQVDFADEGARYRYREVLNAVFAGWFGDRGRVEIEAALTGTTILWERYRPFGEVVTEDRVVDNPLFTMVDHPRIGAYLAAGLPLGVDRRYPTARRAPVLGEHTDVVFGERLGFGPSDLAAARSAGTIA
ncbi:2-methylfumaryl-CoA isomerase [Mycolicibacterium sp. 018/SC-01/001]|uniref:CoA transferase n=1 Tax=Mycolicibacterium sp. 018/SC-01/001 TaxID=2592069 RepID=UPI0011816B0E|nr:2-methylfumaryl-CoA isomerase [Mycolicibacterium sp. 018/SC-01/001]